MGHGHTSNYARMLVFLPREKTSLLVRNYCEFIEW